MQLKNNNRNSTLKMNKINSNRTTMIIIMRDRTLNRTSMAKSKKMRVIINKMTMIKSFKEKVKMVMII